MKDWEREICENLDWQIYECDDGTVELEKYSPAGEDFVVSVQTENFIDEVKAYAAGFDIDEHIELWIGSRGKQGVPSSVRELVEDAEAIDAMLKELAEALFAAELEADGT